jgi:ATP-dependent DNA helicase PIF1
MIQINECFSRIEQAASIFFDAQVWRKASFRIYELNGIFRQKDEEFISILNAVRTGDITSVIIDKLNTRVTKKAPSDNILTLATTNRVVSEINAQHLQSLKSKEYTFNASVTGTMGKSVQPTETTLRLKKGAQVMLVRNDKAKRWANGSIGRVYSCDSDIVRVEVNGRIYTVAPETWKTIEYAYDSVADAVVELTTSSFTQLPIKLAWAVTIHKAQGQTLEDVIIDFAQGTFAHGQAYVALSRCVSFRRLYLTRPIRAADIIVDNRVAAFMAESSPAAK